MSRSMSMIGVIAIALIVVASTTVNAWGPVSHYYFACESEVTQNDPYFDLNTLLVGADLPDGMWNGWFMAGTECPTAANQLHSPVFATSLIQAAATQTAYMSPYFQSLAYGFASHVVSDAVGFSSQGGYLGNASSIIDWSTEWGFMLSVDAYILANMDWPTICPLPSAFPTKSLDQSGIDFIATVIAQNPSMYPQLNASDIAACLTPWGPQVNQMNAIARTQVTAATEQQLMFFDRFNAADMKDVVDHLTASISCIDATLAYYFGLVQSSATATPLEIWTETNSYIKVLFDQGKCTTAATKLKSY